MLPIRQALRHHDSIHYDRDFRPLHATNDILQQQQYYDQQYVADHNHVCAVNIGVCATVSEAAGMLLIAHDAPPADEMEQCRC